MRQILEHQIVEIAAAAGEEAQILPPLRRIADLRANRRHRLSPSPIRHHITPRRAYVVTRFARVANGLMLGQSWE
jgi:hypothetical protein